MAANIKQRSAMLLRNTAANRATDIKKQRERRAQILGGDLSVQERAKALPEAMKPVMGMLGTTALGKVSNAFARQLFELRDDAANAIKRRDWSVFRELIENAGSDEELEVLRRTLDINGFNPDRYIGKTRFSPKQNQTLSVQEMEGAIEGTARRVK